ncbi:uncharacterized protein ACRADG_002369 [Cochliomyia hominivorax]
MYKIIPIILFVTIFCGGSKAGFLRSQLSYNSGYPSGIPFAVGHHSSYAAPFATPLPVAPLSSPHPYAAIGYSLPPVFKYRSRGASFGPFTTYASVRSHHKFAFPAPVPSFYNAPHFNAPPPVTYSAPVAAYGPPAIAYGGDFEEPSTIVKYGPPITTTTTTYSTTAAAASATTLPVATPLNAGW